MSWVGSATEDPDAIGYQPPPDGSVDPLGWVSLLAVCAGFAGFLVGIHLLVVELFVRR